MMIRRAIRLSQRLDEHWSAPFWGLLSILVTLVFILAIGGAFQ